MARSARITSTGQHALLRAAAESFSRLLELLFSRYPDNEWATFARFGWRQTPDGLVLTLADLMPPMQGELDESVGHVKIREPYTLRAALEAERHPLAIGVIHSHPLDCPPDASPIDDDMDGYYAKYFGPFAPGRPYVSLIISRLGTDIAVGGRVHSQGQWSQVRQVAVERGSVRAWNDPRAPSDSAVSGRDRLVAAFGIQSARRLRRS